MSKITVLAGDVEPGVYYVPNALVKGEFVMKKQVSLQVQNDLTIEIERVELQTEESVKKFSGTAGWGLAGLALLGPLGAIGGMLIGGRDKQICFAVYLKDGRKFLATTDGKTYQNYVAATF
ncbi:MAG: hypothetical protein ACOYL3_16320 [Desulfuromonadaceae bacterium]